MPVPEAGWNAVGSRFTLGGLRRFGPISMFDSIRITWPEWSDATAEAVLGRPIAGDLADGRYIIAEPSRVDAIEGEGAQRSAKFTLGNLRLYQYRPPGHGEAVWLYSLLNFQIDGGDLVVEEISGRESIRWRRDALRFPYADREWLLRDQLDPTNDKERREFHKQHGPVATGLLWTPAARDDRSGTIDELASQICNLVSFATGRSVRWRARQHVSETGETSEGLMPFPWCAPASAGGNGPVDTSSGGDLSQFLETSATEYQRDPQWWNRTLELHLQGTLSQIIDVRLTFFYVLFDRVSRRVIGKSASAQIDDHLAERLDESWTSELHAHLLKLSDKWPEERTKEIVRTIKMWNAEPSFVKRVKDAATSLGLREPVASLVRPRNLLVHEGEVPEDLPKGIGDLGDFSRAVEALITAMILRMLGWSGNAYLPDAGRDYEPIQPWPENRSVPWAPVVNPPTASGAG